MQVHVCVYEGDIHTLRDNIIAGVATMDEVFGKQPHRRHRLSTQDLADETVFLSLLLHILRTKYLNFYTEISKFPWSSCKQQHFSTLYQDFQKPRAFH
ncbi:hypothetical protein L1887_18279 [Cichorium endivia]|nr:hypothetical protein L1887_18279 [Cichorium endivia]